jgi:acetylornithine deacetylase
VKLALERDLSLLVAKRAGRLIEITQSLVRIPSENRAPVGNELECQQYAADLLERSGWNPVIYNPDEVAGLVDHPLYWPGRDYTNRPNVAAIRKGTGGGKSLILSGHIDTVPAGSEPWTRDPFGGQVEDNRLYGRGSNDMKAGVATNLFVAEILNEAGLELAGNVTIESVVDEEFGGVNGTLAGRLAGYVADAAIISEPTSLRVCPAQRGGRTIDVTFHAPNKGILSKQGVVGVIEQLRVFLNELPKFREQRRQRAPRHPMYAHLAEVAPVQVTRMETAPWGTSEPTNTPAKCRLQLFWQTMPGEEMSGIDAEFISWMDRLIADHPEVFAHRPAIEYPIRWLPGSALDAGHPLVAKFRTSAGQVLAQQTAVEGIEGPCDMFVFHEFGIPALLWGARGGNTHMPDEYVEIDSMVDAAKVLLRFVCDWCGLAG